MSTLAYIALVFWAFALLDVILNLLLVGRPRTTPLTRYPLVSLIVPARNEERAIETAVRGFLAQDYPSLEVIVVNDRSVDATGSILRRIADEDARLTVVDGEETPPGWLGKPWALHQGSQRARGELLLFVDADVHYEPQTVTTLVRQIEATRDDMMSVVPYLEVRGVWENALMPAVPMTPYAAPLWLGEFVPFTYLAVGGGTGNMIRREAYDDVGGHVALSDAVIDDIGLAHHVRRSGLRTGVIRADRLVSVRMYHGLREIIRGFTKNMFAALYRSYVAVVLVLAYFAIVHLLPYVLAIAGNRIAIATVVLILATRVVFFAAFRYPIWSALLLHPLTTAGWMWITVRSAWVTGIRGHLDWRGRTYDAQRTRFGAER